MRKIGGFTIVELLVVAAIFATVVSAFFGAAILSKRASRIAGEKVQAAFWLEEGAEAVRFLRDTNWSDNIDDGSSVDSARLGYEQCLYFDHQENEFSTIVPEIVSHWHLDESGSSFVDASGTGNDGTCTNCPDEEDNDYTGFEMYNAQEFDGAQDFLDTTIGANTLFGGVGEVSLETWIRPDNNQSSGIIWSSSNTTNSNHGGLELVDNKVAFVLPHLGSMYGPLNDSIGLVSNTTLENDKWYHIVGVYDDTDDEMLIYINGDLDITQSVTLSSSIPWILRFFIGARNTQGIASMHFNGHIDEVAIYNRALEHDEILDRFMGHSVCPRAENASSISAGPVAGSSATNDNSNGGVVTWTNTGNVFTEDGIEARAAHAGAQTAKYLKITGFGFDSLGIPLSANIVGVEARVKRRAFAVNKVSDANVRLVVGGVVSGDDKAKAIFWPTILTSETYGGSTDMWGLGLTVDDVEDPGFGVAIASKNAGSTVQGRVDYVEITVYYLPPTVADSPDYEERLKFNRSVTFQNVCRSDVMDDTEDDIIGTSELRVCTSGVEDVETKRAILKVFWGEDNEFLEEVEMYITNLFEDE